MTPRPGARFSTSLTIAAPALLAAALCVYELSTRSLWLDEGASVAIASQHGGALWRAIAHDGGNMLVYYLLLHGVIALFGSGEVAIRLPSLLADAASAGVVAALGARLFDRRTGVTAGLLVAVSLPLVFWGQDARGYAPMVACSAASFVPLASVVGAPAGAPARRSSVIAYGVLTLLALYLGFDAALVVPAQLLVVAVVAPERLRALAGCLVAVGLACVPLIVLAVERGSGQLFWVPSLSLSVLDQAATTLTSSGIPPNFHATATGTLALLVSAGLLAGALTISSGDGGRLLAGWLVVPAVLGVGASLVGEPIELARTSTLLIPPGALLIARLLSDPRLPRGVGWAGLAVVLVLRALQLAPSYGVSPENWKAATRYVLGAQDTADCVAFYPQDGRMPFDYYARRAASVTPVPVLPALPFSVVRPYVERYVVPGASRLDAIAARCPRLWLIASHQGQRSGPPASRRNYAGYEALLAALARRYPGERARSFGYAAVITVTRFSR